MTGEPRGTIMVENEQKGFKVNLERILQQLRYKEIFDPSFVFFGTSLVRTIIKRFARTKCLYKNVRKNCKSRQKLQQEAGHSSMTWCDGSIMLLLRNERYSTATLWSDQPETDLQYQNQDLRIILISLETQQRTEVLWPLTVITLEEIRRGKATCISQVLPPTTLQQGPLSYPSAPAGPEMETAPAGPEIMAPAGPEITASAGPEATPPERTMRENSIPAGSTDGGRDHATRKDSPEHYNLSLPPPLLQPQTPWNNGESSFKDRGKGPDARNWGDAGLNEMDTDPGVQAQILNSFETVNADSKEKHQIFNYLEQWRASETERIQREIQNSMAGRLQELEELIKAAQLTAKENDMLEGTYGGTVARGEHQTNWKKRHEAPPKRPSDLIAPKSHVAHIFSALRERKHNSHDSSPEPSGDSSGEETDNNDTEKGDKSKKPGNKWGDSKNAEKYNGSDALQNGKPSSSTKDSSPKGKANAESKGPPGFTTNNVEWNLANRAGTSNEIREFSASYVTFDWADDVEETYYADNLGGITSPIKHSSSSCDDDDSLPDLTPVSDSGSDDEWDLILPLTMSGI
ncbi:hypothetical protein GGU11DRAFT_758209 [Lentinula aff. detonsa]|nr:hypothetical protein GGU11DRAFT_758209 [Lentinula aff. detonsa]